MSTPVPWARERQVAEAAVKAAAKLTKRVQSTVKEVSKADASPVTAADFAAQALLTQHIRRAFPDDAIVGEEDSSVLRSDGLLGEKVYLLFREASSSDDDDDDGVCSLEDMLDLIDVGGKGMGGGGRFWTMDPIDGTAAFLRGEQFAVAVGLVEGGKEVVGVIACPNLKVCNGVISEAIVDQELGVVLSALPAPRSLSDLHIVDCPIGNPPGREAMRLLAARVQAPFPGTDIWSSHVRYAALILGGGNVLVRVPASGRDESCIWDHAGAQLLYSELGGLATDLDGRPLDFTAGRYLCRNRGLVVAHEGVHGRVLAELRSHHV
ncbi:myo-inositol-1(or 4)-monophosphatase [Ophiocordyceps camponoti-floridani]|uniref:Myo-inositol-1(Or 4)-monophosphatase n=1 Tax=Ophiocordyceps camponoti-floridani TaxID=2030778 RepID=A0A8H4VAH7_9HYPO|nr:myo-inositol-1(or 4)-monophosphatase [Ophiocordyceps camponoti-floridani]